MTAEHSFPENRFARGSAGEFAGRLALASAVAAIVYAIWMVNLPSAANWTALYARVAPRLSVFALGLFMALAIQSCSAKNRTLFLWGVLALAGLFALQRWTGLFEIYKLPLDAAAVSGTRGRDWTDAGRGLFVHARPNMLAPGTAVLLMRFECALFAAVFLGTWIGRGVTRGWHFLTLLLFGAACDASLIGHWRVADSMFPGDPLAVLRMPFVPMLGRVTVAPAATDIFFVSAALEGARLFRMHSFWLALGAVTGYCCGTFFGGFAPGISMGVVALGMLVAAWPEMRLDSISIAKCFLAVTLLIMTLAGMRALRFMLNAPPPQRIIREPEQMRNVACGAAYNIGNNESHESSRMDLSVLRKKNT